MVVIIKLVTWEKIFGVEIAPFLYALHVEKLSNNEYFTQCRPEI